LMTMHVRPGDSASADMAFTVGIMSLMDALFAVPMHEILEKVDAADEVRAALLGREGDFGIMLKVVDMLERAQGGRPLSAALKKLGLTVKQVREIELEAFEWVRELGCEVHLTEAT
ncbi:MAG TPA: EAL domain-containing protein, partial [Telluria sp.]